MKKVLFTLSVLGLFVFANANTNKQIEETKAQIAELQATLQKLEESLTTKAQKEEAIALAKKKKDEKLKVHGEFGLIDTKGNTHTLSYNLDTKIKKNIDDHEFTLIAYGEYASEQSEKTKNKYFVEFDYGHRVSKTLSYEYITAYKYDEFSGYDYRFYTGPGIKYNVLNSDLHTLDLGHALLFSRDKKETEVDAYNYTSYRIKAEYSRQLLQNLKLEETFSYQTDVTALKDFFIYSKTALISKISDIFSVSLNYKVDYVHNPDIGKKRADRTLSASLIADF